MSIKQIKSNIMFLVISYIFLIIFLFFTSYHFFLSDFNSLERTQNKNNLNTFLATVDKNIENIRSTASDYSNWDDTYEFIQDGNKEYIYNNFREGTDNLESLGIDSIIYLNLEDKIIYSKYNNKLLESKQSNFENLIITKFKDYKDINTVFNYNSNLVYLTKNGIFKSDKTGKIKGFIIAVKLVSNKSLNEKKSIFKSINLSENISKENQIEVNLPILKNIKINIEETSQLIINNIQFFDEKGNYLLSLVTSNERDIVNNGKKTIYTFNLIVTVILFFIFFYIYKNQYLIENQNQLLNIEVNKRTKQLDKAFRELKNKNNELYTLANIDSLTKIKNRRSFFLESEILLEKAIKENNNLCVLMIDIDHFKSINDKFGHAVGDFVLIEFCTIVDSIIKDDGIFGRIGGEEFCITFHDISIDEANDISEKIRDKCENTIIELQQHKIKFTVSMGLTCRDNLTNIDKILHKSDELLYEAKNTGRNRLIRTNR